jgi:pyrroloquinoline-quinone synthase
VKKSLWSRIEEARSERNVLEHPFYQRWSAGELTRDELAHYSGEYRHAVEAVAELSEVAAARAPELTDHAAEERDHVALWDGFLRAAGGVADRRPASETAECVRAWTHDDLLGSLVALYAIESGQPEISQTKLQGLTSHYGFAEGPATEYFSLHSERDHEHAAEAKEMIEPLLAGADEDELVEVAARVFEGNWTLLDGVERAFAG